jgi:plastocyanin
MEYRGITGFGHTKGLEVGMRIHYTVLLVVFGLLLLGSAVWRVRGEPQDAVVTFANFSYSPATVTIRTGEAVEWQGNFTSHPLVSQDGLWPTVGSGTSFSHTFNQPGEYWYYCEIHGFPNGVGMSGKVIVEDTQTLFLPFLSR